MQGLYLNSKGFALHGILPLVIVIAIVGGIGTYVINKSNAASPNAEGSVTCSIVSKPNPTKGRYAAITVSIQNNTASTIKSARAEVNDNNSTLANILLEDIAPGSSSSGTRDIQVEKDATVLHVQGGTTTSDFSNCSKSWTL